MEFQNILCTPSAWHRLMMLEGLANAGDGHEGFGERERKLQSHYWPQISLQRPAAGLQAVREIKAATPPV